jgi:hypothetical protein
MKEDDESAAALCGSKVMASSILSILSTLLLSLETHVKEMDDDDLSQPVPDGIVALSEALLHGVDVLISLIEAKQEGSAFEEYLKANSDTVVKIFKMARFVQTKSRCLQSSEISLTLFRCQMILMSLLSVQKYLTDNTQVASDYITRFTTEKERAPNQILSIYGGIFYQLFLQPVISGCILGNKQLLGKFMSSLGQFYSVFEQKPSTYMTLASVYTAAMCNLVAEEPVISARIALRNLVPPLVNVLSFMHSSRHNKDKGK